MAIRTCESCGEPLLPEEQECLESSCNDCEEKAHHQFQLDQYGTDFIALNKKFKKELSKLGFVSPEQAQIFDDKGFVCYPCCQCKQQTTIECKLTEFDPESHYCGRSQACKP